MAPIRVSHCLIYDTIGEPFKAEINTGVILTPLYLSVKCYKSNMLVIAGVNQLPITHTYMKQDKFVAKNVKQMPYYKLNILVTGVVNQLPITYTCMKHKYVSVN